MLLDINHLPREGATLDTVIPVPVFPWEGGGEVRCEPFALTGRLRPTRFGWELLAQMRGQVWVPCTRCLVEFELPVEKSFRLVIAPPPGASEGGLTFATMDDDDPEAVDLYPLPGTKVDLADLVREQIDLALPVRTLCKESCRGLCPHCGVDRNTNSCGCAQQLDERWGNLAELKQRLEQKQRDRHK